MIFPRWIERFSGTLVRPRIPVALFESLARRVEANALVVGVPESRNLYRVVDATEEFVPSGYRVADEGGRCIHIVAASAPTAHHLGLNDVRIWQEGAHTLRYEVGFPRLLRRAFVRFVAIAVSGALGPLLLVATRSAPLVPIAFLLSGLWALFAILLVAEAAFEAWRARRALERILDHEIGKDQEAEAALGAPTHTAPLANADDDLDAEETLEDDLRRRSSAR